MLLWNNRYQTGVERIDREHQAFFQLLERFRNQREADVTKEHLSLIVQEMILQAKAFFSLEEQLMQEARYAGADGHGKQHRRYIDELVSKATGYSLGHSSALEVEDVMMHWLAAHVPSEDKRFGEFAAANPADPCASG